MNIVYQGLQYNPGKTCRTSYQDSGKYQELVPAESVVEPMQDDFVASRFFKSIFLKVSLKLQEAQKLFFIMNIHFREILTATELLRPVNL